MIIGRRTFLRHSALVGALSALGKLPIPIVDSIARRVTTSLVLTTTG